MENRRGQHTRRRFTGCRDDAESFLCHIIDCLFVFGKAGIEDLVEDGLGVRGLFNVAEAELGL